MPLVKIYMQFSSVRNFFPTFFRSNHFIFRNFLKDRFKKAFLGTFWKIFTKKKLFYSARPPSKLFIMAPKTPLEKILRLQKWMS